MRSKLILVFGFCVFLMSAQIPTTGLVGAWPFSGNANDISGSANHGTVTGASLIADRCGNPNSAYNFTGSDYIVMAAPGPTGTAARSVCFWARSTNTLSGSFSTPVAPFDYGGATSVVGAPFEIVWNYFCQAVGIDTGTHSLGRGTSCINNGQWHFIAITWDPLFGSTISDAKVYVDAVQQTAISCFVTGTTQAINTGANSPVTIGKAACCSVRYFLGGLDDFYLYNRALTSTEISQMYTVTPCSPAITGNTLVCPNATYVYSVAPITGATYTWSLPAGWTGTSTVNSITVVTGTASGAMSVAGSSSCGLTPVYSLTVSTTSTPSITAASNFPILCFGNNATLTANGANTYSWQGISNGTVSIVVTPSMTTTYTVTGTNTLSGCTGSTTVTQTVVITPTVIANSSGSLSCSGNTATLTASGANSYVWQPGGLTGSLVTVSPTASTIYTVTGVASSSCPSSSATLQILSPTPLSLNVTGSPTACIPTSVTLSANASGGTAPYSYTWTSGPLTSTNMVAQSVAGTYIYTVTVKDFKNCTQTATNSVSFFNVPAFTVSSETICPATTGTLGAGGVATYTWYPGAATGSQVSVSPPATSIYTVIGTTSQGCTVSAQTTVTVKPGVSLSFNTFTITCGNLGSATVTAAGTPGPFTYSWMPTAQTGSVANGLFPGNYTLQVFDASTGCVNTGTTYFAPLVPLTGTVSATGSLVCYGDATGIASIALSGGSGAQTYNWTNSAGNQTTAVASNLTAGGHTITVTDGLTFCSVTHTFFVQQPPDFTLTIVPVTPSVCLGGNITYTAINSGGTPGYTYTWTAGPATDTFVVNESTAGIYIYTVTSMDSHACTTTKTVSGQFVINPTVTVNSVSICPLVFGTLTANGASTYSWSNSFVGNPMSASPNVSSSYVVIGSALGCTAAAVGTITVMPTPVVSYTSDSPVCNGATLHLIATSTGTAYSWTGPLSFTSNSQFVAIPATPPKSGFYTLKVTASNGCTASATNSLTVYPTPTLSIAGSTVCETQSLTLNSNFLGGGAYNWSGPSSFTSSLQNPVLPNADITMTGAYNLTLTSVYGCTNTAVVQASVAQKPTVLINTLNDLCVGTQLVMSSSGGDSYSWFGPGGFYNTQSAFTISPAQLNASGIYTLQIVKGPCISIGSTTVTVHAPPQLTVNINTPVCEHQLLNLSASGANTYTWTGPDNLVSSSNPTAVILNVSGINNYTLNAADQYGCLSQSIMPVYILPAPVASVSEGTVCLGGPLTITASGGVSYLWSGPNGFSSLSNAVTIASVTQSLTGIYTVNVAGTNSCSTSATVDVIIMPYEIPVATISLSAKAACINSNLLMTGSGGISYVWTGPKNFKSNNKSVTLNNISADMAGVYTLSVKNSSNCVGASTTQITVFPQPKATLYSDKNKLCEPVCVSLRLEDDTNNVAPINTSRFAISTDVNPLKSNIFCAKTQGNYVLNAIYSDTNNCANTATLVLVVYPTPNADFLYSPARPLAGIDEIEFHNNTLDDGNTQWFWFMDNQDTIRGKDPKYTYNTAGDHMVALVVKNQWGCVDTIIQMLTIDDEFNLYVPNAFTPNGDGLNDVFGPKGSGIQKFKLEVYTRWGQRIFESDNLDKTWDGTFKGKECKTDSYVWTITVFNSLGKRKDYNGSVLLLRAEIKQEY